MSALSVQEPPAVVRYLPSPAQGSDAERLAAIVLRATVARAELRPVPPPFDSLRADIAADVADKWREPCESAFEYLSVTYPDSLLALIRSNRLAPSDLTFAAEIAGRIAGHESVRAVLVPLLAHAEAVVREGAIYGLTRHLDAPTRALLERLAIEDRSAAVRTAARDALDEG
jgi:HEAT repeat protein